MLKKALLSVGVIIVILAGLGIYSYYKYPNKTDSELSCPAVYDPVEAKHPYLPFIKDSFSNACLAPYGWKAEHKPTRDSEKFSGAITKLKTDCAFDGECSIFVGDKEVVISGGEMISETKKGTSEINSFQSSWIGSKVDVYAQKLSSQKYTLIGSTKYYVKLSK